MLELDYSNLLDITTHEFLGKLVVCSLLGLVIRECFRSIELPWANSSSSLLLFGLLPAATYSVTSIIAGNIALSLGMVGALSIIRFRNPVRSSAELVSYFILITVGICMIKSFISAIMLVVLVIFFTQVLRLVMRFRNPDNLAIFSNDNLSQSIYVTAQASELIPQKITNQYKTNQTYFKVFQSEQVTHQYRWEFRSKEQAHNLMDELRNATSVEECVLSTPDSAV